MSVAEKTVPVYTRLPVALAERLEREAHAADRTMAGQVRHVIKAHLLKQGGKES